MPVRFRETSCFDSGSARKLQGWGPCPSCGQRVEATSPLPRRHNPQVPATPAWPMCEPSAINETAAARPRRRGPKPPGQRDHIFGAQGGLPAGGPCAGLQTLRTATRRDICRRDVASARTIYRPWPRRNGRRREHALAVHRSPNYPGWRAVPLSSTPAVDRGGTDEEREGDHHQGGHGHCNLHPHTVGAPHEDGHDERHRPAHSQTAVDVTA